MENTTQYPAGFVYRRINKNANMQQKLWHMRHSAGVDLIYDLNDQASHLFWLLNLELSTLK